VFLSNELTAEPGAGWNYLQVDATFDVSVSTACPVTVEISVSDPANSSGYSQAVIEYLEFYVQNIIHNVAV
jgi:hypothetical protein